MSRRFSPLLALSLLLAPTLMALSGCAPRPNAAGRWVGTVTPQGAAAHGPASEEVCIGPTRGVLSFRGRRFQFEPNEGTLVMPGYADAAGHLTASLTRPASAHQAWTASFSGAVRDQRIEGVLITPECRADVRLTHESGPGFFNDLLRD